MESGLLKKIERTWMPNPGKQNIEFYDAIDFSQISLILKIWCLGFFLSFVILLMEYLIFSKFLPRLLVKYSKNYMEKLLNIKKLHA